MLNSDSLYYTYMHRKAFTFTVNKIVKNVSEKIELMRRAWFHDIDKMFLYTLIPHDEAHEYHVQHAHHHMENSIPKTTWDCMEAVIDYECAGFTKADKPLNAYDTVLKYNRDSDGRLMAIMKDWGIATSYQNTPDDEEWVHYLKTIPQPTDKQYLAEIYWWITKQPYKAMQLLQYAKGVSDKLK